MNNDLRQQIIECLDKAPHSPGVHQGSRKLKHGIPGKRIIFFSSIKNGLLTPCESRLESDHCLHMEFDDDIASYRTQPLTFGIGDRQSYTPDCVLCTHHNDLICREIKVSEKLNSPRLQERLSHIRNILANAGIGFEIVTEKQICVYPDIYNKKLLYKAKRERYSQFHIEQAKTLLSREISPFSLRKARQICNEQGLPNLIVDQLLSNGFLGFDENKNLCSDSLIYLEGGAK